MTVSKLRQAAGYVALSSVAASLLMAMMREHVAAPAMSAAGERALPAPIPPRPTAPRRFESTFAGITIGVRRVTVGELAPILLMAGWLVVSLIGFLLLKPDDVFFYRPVWLLHPFEQEHLTIAKHIAEHGTPFIRDPWFGQTGHGSEDMAYRGGAIVPRASLGVYYLYAVPFLISDTAWLWVTPFFGAMAAAGVVAIVARRTSLAVGLMAGAGFVFTAPVMIAASGLVFDNIIALALAIWGLYGLDRMRPGGSLRWGVFAGMFFAGAAMIRADYAPIGALAVAWLIVARVGHWRRPRLLDRNTAAAACVMLPVVAAVLAFVVSNRMLYGGSLDTGYSATAVEKAPVWAGSAGGVLHVILTFSPGEFLDMAHAFLWEIGRAQVILALLGIAYLVTTRRFRASDAALFGFCLFTLVLNLGHSGTHGGARAILVHSPPRYMLPVYTAGVIWGFEAVYGISRRVTVRSVVAPAAVILGMTLLVAGEGLREAYGTPYGFIEVRRTSERTRAVYDFAVQHPDDVFVGDIYAKGLIGQRTIIPRRLADPEDLGRYLRDDLAAGRRVFLLDKKAYTLTSPDYSGYYETLRNDGFLLTRVSVDPEITEVEAPGTGSASVAISVLGPSDGVELTGAAHIEADADATGGVRRVDFVVGDQFLGSKFSAPYTLNWDTRSVADGVHSISVVAVSNSGQAAVRDVRVSVRNGGPGDPAVRIAAPRTGQTVSGLVPVIALAADVEGMDLVHFYVDGEYRASDGSAPFGWWLDSRELPNGAHSIWTKALDEAGHSTVTYLMVNVEN